MNAFRKKNKNESLKRGRKSLLVKFESSQRSRFVRFAPIFFAIKCKEKRVNFTNDGHGKLAINLQEGSGGRRKGESFGGTKVGGSLEVYGT